MARAIWKGVIRLGKLQVPVKLYSAVQDRSVHFRLLHATDLVPVQQQMVNSVSGEPVEREQIRKGYELEDGTFVLLSDEELETIRPEPSRDIEVLRVVDPAEITQQWYERPYFLGPDEDEQAYFALVEALHRSGRKAVVRWVMRNTEYHGAVGSTGKHLTLVTLRSASEVIPASALPAPAGRALDAKELQMAEQLVNLLEDEFEPEAFRDEYRERVLELIEAKAAGRKPKLKAAPKRARAKSLASALEASVKQLRDGKQKRAA